MRSAGCAAWRVTRRRPAKRDSHRRCSGALHRRPRQRWRRRRRLRQRLLRCLRRRGSGRPRRRPSVSRLAAALGAGRGSRRSDLACHAVCQLLRVSRWARARPTGGGARRSRPERPRRRRPVHLHDRRGHGQADLLGELRRQGGGSPIADELGGLARVRVRQGRRVPSSMAPLRPAVGRHNMLRRQRRRRPRRRAHGRRVALAAGLSPLGAALGLPGAALASGRVRVVRGRRLRAAGPSRAAPAPGLR
mmetsp:Transcript_21818/g.83008  ORF Transcript_21818/g.83008 Transcript_21818/m.83008 type:complete len:248 (-) Transcript_21818:437-1180(-)